MISAKEALKYSTDITNKKLADELTKVETAIKASIDKADTSCYLAFWVSGSVKKELESLGYQVECGSDRNESFTSISWAPDKKREAL